MRNLTSGKRSFAFRSLAIAAVASTLVLTSGVVAANAAAADHSQSTGTFLSGTLFSDAQLVQLGSATASNNGLEPTEVDQSNLDASVLNAMTVTAPGGVGVPLSMADAGTVGNYAQAEDDGSSYGASGVLGSDGAIGVGAPGAGSPAPLTVDLDDTLDAGSASELSDLDLSLGAVSASASIVAGGTPTGAYEIVGSSLVFTSETLAGLTGEVGTLVDALDADLDLLTGTSGVIANDILDSLGILGPFVAINSGNVSITVGLDAAVAPLLTGTLGAGEAVSFDLATGVVTVDLALLNGGTLNGLAPNTVILSSAQLSSISTALTTLVTAYAADVEAAISTALGAAVVDIDLAIDVLGLPVGSVEIDGTVDEVVAGTAITSITIAGVGVGDILPGVGTILDDFLDASGSLGTFIDGLQTELVDPVADVLGPVLIGLEDVLRITVNNQDPEPAVAGQVFTETAFRLELLAPAGGPITSAVTLDVAQATVGPNLVGSPAIITGLVPDNGPESGGTIVTITGTNFLGSSGVTFDGIPGAFVVDSDTQITVTTPAHAPGPVDVVVLGPEGASLPATFTYTPLIAVTDIDPNFGPLVGGTAVDIFGVCFTGATGVTFDGIAGTSFTVVDDAHITVVSPPHAAGAVDVVISGSVICGGDATVTDGFTYVAPGAPTITGIVPDNGPESGGTAVVITGTGFTGATGVTFDGLSGTAFTVVNDTTINVTSPPHAPGIVGVVVEHAAGDSGPFDFTYTPLIGVTSIDPDFGPEGGGTIVEITGVCFTGATGVLFDGVAAIGFVVNSDTSIIATTPPGIPGFVDVTIQGAMACGGDEVVPDGFQYISDDAPVLLSLTPDSGPQSGGTLVTITGSGFTGATGVTFDGIAGTSFTVIDDTTATVVSPAHAPGLVDVVMQHPDGPSAPLGFTYLPATTIIGVNPGSGPEAGGTPVTITGSCFVGATAVLFGSAAAASFVVVNDSTITAVTPPGVGVVDVTVIGSLLCGNDTLDDGYRFIPAAALAATGSTVAPFVNLALLLLMAGAALTMTRKQGDAIG